METMVWDIVLSTIVGIVALLARSKFDQLERISLLLNRTREEIARDNITRTEVRADMQQTVQMLVDRFDRIERKLDAIRAEAFNKD
jgi:hypothetical protein